MARIDRASLPRLYSWFLPFQCCAAVLAAYSTTRIYDLDSTPSALALVAVIAQVVLGSYGWIRIRRAKGPGLVFSVLLLALAGLWWGPVVIHARVVNDILRYHHYDYDESDEMIWSYIGLGASILSMLLNLVLVAVNYTASCGPRKQGPTPGFQSWPAITSPPQASYSMGPILPVANDPPPEYQPQNPNITPPPAAAVREPEPLRVLDGKSSPATPTPKTLTPITSSSTASASSYNRDNRVEVIRRLCDLQHADGHWEYSQELATLVSRWGGRELGSVAHGATALTQACLMELCDRVWAAQRDGTEDTTLTSPEVASLQMMHWDLEFAKSALDRATAWLTGFR